MPARGADGRFIAGIELGLEDKLSGPMDRLGAKFAPWGKKAASAWDPFKKASQSAEKSWQSAANMKQAAEGVKTFGDQVGGLIQKPIKTFMGFEKQMSSVKAALFSDEDTAESRAAMEAVAASARKLGEETKFSATEAAQGMDILAKNFKDGPEKAQEVMKAMPGILDVAAAGEVSIADAADVASAAMNQFGMSAKDMGKIGDIIVKSANSSATGVNEIGASLKNAGVAAAGAGISLEKTGALIAALANAGVKGGEAGTALRAMILRLQAPTTKGKSALKFLGIDTKDKAGNLKPIEQLLAEIDKAADKKFGKDKNGNRRAALMKGIFEDEAFAAANILTAQAGSGELAKVIEANYASAGTAAKVAKVMSDNAAGAMANYESAVEELQLTIGERLIPKVTELFKWADEMITKWAAWAKENPGLVTGLGYTAGAIAAVSMVVWAGTTAAAAATTAWGGLTKAWGIARVSGALLTKGLHLMKVAMLANPVHAALIGIATAAYLIYENWEPIKTFFIGVWDSITSGAKKAFEWVLDKINWIGEQIEAFKISVMTEDEAAEYVGKKEAEFAANKAGSALFADDLDGDPNSITRGKPAFGFKPEPTLVDTALAGVKSRFSTLENPFAATGAPLSPEEFNRLATSVSGTKGAEFAGDLKITIDSEGNVKGTRMQQKGNAGFAVRVNTGAQAA